MVNPKLNKQLIKLLLGFKWNWKGSHMLQACLMFVFGWVKVRLGAVGWGCMRLGYWVRLGESE